MSLEGTVSGSGPDVVLLHGLGATRYSWRHTVAALEGHARTHALDLASFGESAKPSGFECSMAEHADLVIEHLEAGGVTSFDLIGHSMGGGIACYIADRLRNDTQRSLKVGRLVLVGALVYPDGKGGSNAFDASLLKIVEMLLSPDKERARFFLETVQDDANAVTDEQAEAYAVNFTVPGLFNLRAHRERFAEIEELKPRYPDFELETLAIWGRRDAVLPLSAYGEPIVDQLQNGRLAVVEDCGHIPQEEKPDETSALIADFLR